MCEVTDRENFKRQVRSKAELLGLTMSVLATLVGVTPGTISALLSGRSHNVHLARDICKVLDIPEAEANKGVRKDSEGKK